MQLSPNDLSSARRTVSVPLPIDSRHSREKEDLRTAKKGVNRRRPFCTPVDHGGRGRKGLATAGEDGVTGSIKGMRS